MATMSKLVTMPPKPPLKQLVCKLIGTPGVQTIPFRLDSDAKTLQHQIKKQFNSKVDARDLMLYSARHKYGKDWLRIHDAAVDTTFGSDSPDKVKRLVHNIQLIDEKNITPEVFWSAPEEYVVHILAKECPVDPKRAARWEHIQQILPPQEPRWKGMKPVRPPSTDEWHKLYEHAFKPDLQQYSEAVAPIRAKELDYLVSWLGSEYIEFVAERNPEVYLRELLGPCVRDHPDLSMVTNATIHGFRTKYHSSNVSCEISYQENTIFVGETDCDDVKEGIARALTARVTGCEVAADSSDLHEVFGAVVTKDGQWIFLRSLDEKILIDDDVDNRLVFDDKGQPSRESIAKLCGKLHSMTMANLTPPEPGWRELWGVDDDDEDE